MCKLSIPGGDSGGDRLAPPCNTRIVCALLVYRTRCFRCFPSPTHHRLGSASLQPEVLGRASGYQEEALPHLSVSEPCTEPPRPLTPLPPPPFISTQAPSSLGAHSIITAPSYLCSSGCKLYTNSTPAPAPAQAHDWYLNCTCARPPVPHFCRLAITKACLPAQFLSQA